MPLLILLAAVIACSSDKEEDVTPTPTNQQPQQCDTNNVTYSGTVAGIIAANCNSCHSTAVATNGVVLDNHARLKQYADNGKLMGVINHAPGFPPMPQGGAKLSDCNIAKIKKWVDAGAPNN
ncbi:hypothetical protein TH63_10860 [Rufibacter radiotolerans]|uniref:Cytochrome c domain-containing protein n=1 Tax=Rufibacter radiotolerans TaxID=1379910 RepID=A0A0H4VJP2_9BACT|nr:hypothetical protein TH63_10860 [Rufibacter radiotolerans]